MLELCINLSAIICAYLIGSVSSAIIICKLMGLQDPRTAGSGNPGATNVLRVGGKLPAIITLLGDALKGFLPVVITANAGFSETVIALSAFVAFLGHLYPIFFRFQGGKGVATCLGALIGLNVALACLVIGVWILIFATLRYSSLAALTGISVGLLYAWHVTPIQYFIAYAAMTLILFWRHRSNIERLVKGTEPTFSKRKDSNLRENHPPS